MKGWAPSYTSSILGQARSLKPSLMEVPHLDPQFLCKTPQGLSPMGQLFRHMFTVILGATSLLRLGLDTAGAYVRCSALWASISYSD